MGRFLIAILGLALLAQPVFAQRRRAKGDEEVAVRPPQAVRVQSVDRQVQVDSGAFVYALPRTVLRLSVEVEREIFTAGPYAAYAEKLLGLTAAGADKTSYAVRQCRVEAYEEADVRQLYVVQPGDNAMRFDFFKLTKDGLMLLPGNDFSQVANGASGGFPAPSGSMTMFTNMGVESMFREVKLPPAAPDTAAAADTAGEEDDEVAEAAPPPVVLQAKTEEERAAEAANLLFNLRRRKYELLTGDIDAVFNSNEALKVALKELNKMERSYLALFVGRRAKAKVTYRYDVAPTAVLDSYPLFKFSEESGVQNMEGQGRVVVLDLQPEDKYAAAKISPAPKDDTAFRVRLPDVAQVRLLDGANELYRGRFRIYQNGKMVNVRMEQLLKE